MIRLIIAVLFGALAAFAVSTPYSTAWIHMWEGHEFLRMVVGYGGYPVALMIQLLLGAIGIDAYSSVRPLVWGAFVQWTAVAYLIGGVIAKRDPPPSSLMSGS